MLQAVTIKNDFLPKLQKVSDIIFQPKKGEISLGDSFVKNAAETTPLLLSTTAAVSFVKSKSCKVPFKKIMKQEVNNKFLPILLVVSAASAIFENYITGEDYNTGKSEK